MDKESSSSLSSRPKAQLDRDLSRSTMDKNSRSLDDPLSEPTDDAEDPTSDVSASREVSENSERTWEEEKDRGEMKLDLERTDDVSCVAERWGDAVLDLNNCVTPLSPDQSNLTAENTCVLTSGSPAMMSCELKVDAVDPRRARTVSVAEVKELAYGRLREELCKAQQELKLKDEEVARLSQIRDEVGAELEELTASLFEEAHTMVREANVKQANAEKLLKEANLKIEVLQAEVQALKTLVITSTPSMPNRHLHPQIEKKGNGVRCLFQKGHKRYPSNYELESATKDTPPDSPIKEFASSDIECENNEVDPFFHQEFVSWRQNPLLDKSHPFLSRIYQEDILPCLHFANTQLSEKVLKAIEDNMITVESVTCKSPFPKKCSLLDAPRLCKYRMKLGDDSEWHYISQLCRNRIAAVCDFFCYLRYIQQGLVKNGIHEVYWEVTRRRRDMAVAKLGLRAA
ncbi:guanine nucleotide exchange factor for Rab-3A-like [Centruroides sculpturatus]|uniref:guanine nucleotide exchange factor for Rab-3A-like n=1 Tax=Centruroides sculpturatus TaxID=218467 RepID=UPI000C6EF293|nr:guanine nucleotide exchange factor for Rab-3A-like [Centruroides sculpturatus]